MIDNNTALDELSKYWYHAGRWHDAHCNFVMYDEGMCECDYGANKQAIEQLITKREQAARIDELSHVYTGGRDAKLWSRNTTGAAGEWLTIAERIAELRTSPNQTAEEKEDT